MADVLVPQALATALVREHENDPYLLFSMIPKERTLWNNAKWDKIKTSRTMADYNVLGGKANQRVHRTVESHTTDLAYIREAKTLSADTILWLREPGSENRQYGMKKVADELWDLTDIVKRRIEYSIFEMLTTGAITVANTNRVFFTVDFGQAANHTPVTATSWADVSADIIGDIKTWAQLVEDDHGYKAKYFFLSAQTEQYMIANTAIRELIRTQGGERMLVTGRLPDTIADLDIVRFSEGHCSTVGGSFGKWLDDGHVLITPDWKPGAGGDWLKFFEGPPGDLEALGKNLYGFFSKQWTEPNPSGYHLLVEHHGLPVLQANQAVVYGDTIA